MNKQSVLTSRRNPTFDLWFRTCFALLVLRGIERKRKKAALKKIFIFSFLYLTNKKQFCFYKKQINVILLLGQCYATSEKLALRFRSLNYECICILKRPVLWGLLCYFKYHQNTFRYYCCSIFRQLLVCIWRIPFNTRAFGHQYF